MERYAKTRLARHIHKHGWEVGLSQHPDLTIETIEEYSSAPWEWDVLDTHPNFTIEWIDRFPLKPWDWFHLHMNRNFSFDWVVKYPLQNWNWTALSRKANVATVVKHPDFPWRWNVLTMWSEILPKEMVDNSNLPWTVDLLRFESIDSDDELEFLYHYKETFSPENWDDFTRCATWDIIKKSMDLYWVIENVQFGDETFTDEDMRFLHLHIDREWNWTLLSLIVPFDLIRNNRDLPWNYHIVSLNRTVTYDDVCETPELPWDSVQTPCEPIDKTIRKWCAAKKIQKKWKRCISDPTHPVCRRRLLNEFEQFTCNDQVSHFS